MASARPGRLLLPALAQTSSFRLVESEPSREEDADKLLPATTAECVEEARRAIAHHRFRRAEILLEKADVDPLDKQEMWQAWTDLGQACYAAGVVAQVQTAFLKALKYGPKDMASHFNVALGLHLNEKYEEALAAYLKANQIEPKHPKIWCNLGVLYFQMQQYALAESALRYATLASPDYARAWDNLAAALGAQDKLDEALDACQQAIELRPDYPEAHFKMGVIHFSRNEFDAARRELQRAALLPHLAAFSDCLQAMIHARLEQTEAAEAAVLRAVRTDSKCDLLWMAWNDLGLAHYAAGDFQAAATAYGEATMIKPDEAEAWFNLGVSYHRTGDLKAARDAYQQAVDLRESMSGAWHNLGHRLRPDQRPRRGDERVSAGGGAGAGQRARVVRPRRDAGEAGPARGGEGRLRARRGAQPAQAGSHGARVHLPSARRKRGGGGGPSARAGQARMSRGADDAATAGGIVVMIARCRLFPTTGRGRRFLIAAAAIGCVAGSARADEAGSRRRNFPARWNTRRST